MTTRSSKKIPMVSSNPSDSNPQTPTKRKRPQHDNPGATGWLGIAFQLRSVIKKELNDFVKTIRGSNAPQGALPLDTHPTQNNSNIEPEHAKDHVHRHLSESVTGDHLASRNLHPVYHSTHRLKPAADHFSSLSRTRLPDVSDLDLPSPPKKSKRSMMPSLDTSITGDLIQHNPADEPATDPQQSSFHDFLESNSLIRSTNDITFLPHVAQVDFVQAEADCTDHFWATEDLPAKIKQSHEARDNDSEMEEIICNSPKKAEKRHMCQSSGHLIGYNSVLFPDSRNPHQLDSPGSSVNADLSSSTWQGSSSFSINSGSNMHRGFSNHTSLTSNTSVELNSREELQVQGKGHHTTRLSSVSSQPSPRIRHTKILGSPRNHHTSSASSLSSIGSILTPDVISRHNSHSQLKGGPHHTLNKGINYGLGNIDPPSDNEREFLTSDSDINHESSAAIQIGRRLSSHRPTLTCRRKVPLSEIIGRPLNPTPSLSSIQSHPDYCRESSMLNPSQSIASIASSFIEGSNVAHSPSIFQIQSHFATELQSPATQTNHDNVEDFSTPAADTSANLSVLRNQLSNTMRIGPSSPSEPVPNVMTQSLPSPRQTAHRAMIMEVDEDGEDNSYEFLDRSEALSLSPELPHRKRKVLMRRSDFINFRRPGLAAVQQSPSKLIDLPPNPLLAKSKTNVKNILRLSRGHKRNQSLPHNNLSAKDLGEDDLQSPTKKIRILETEIARLRQELENEKTKSAKKSSMFKSCNQPNDMNDSPHVAFLSRSPLRVSSPVSSRPATRHRRFRSSGKEPGTTSDSPVMVKRPSDGALVGGSPFIVSRVFGQGPEVLGERTPVQAEKWLQKRRVAPVNPDGTRLPALAHDLFGAKSFKLSSSTPGTAPGGTGKSSLNASLGWKRDHQLEADLISTPKARTLKKIYRNSRGATVMPPSQLRNMFGSSTSDSQRIGGPSIKKGHHTGSQSPDLTSFLNELKTSGKTTLRKTPGSSKYYMSQSVTSPKDSSFKHETSRNRRSADIHNAILLNSALHNFGGRESGSTLSGRSDATAASTNTLDSHRGLKESCNPSALTADQRKSSICSEDKPSTYDQIKSPLSVKVYPSGVKANQTQVESDESRVQFVLGEAISTPRKRKQEAHLSRSLVDPHLTPRVRTFNDREPVSTLERDFSMDDLIKQVKDLKDNELMVNQKTGAHLTPVNNSAQNHELLHEMGFCSSIENSLEVCSSHLISTSGPALSSSSMAPITNTSSVCQDINRPRASPLLKSLTEGRPKPSTSPIKKPNFVSKPSNNRWSSSSIRLVSILNNSSDGRSSLDKSGPINPSVKSRSKFSERRVRILEDTTNLNNSPLSTDRSVHRHSLPADLITRNLIKPPQVENKDVNIPDGSNATSQKSQSSSGPDWVLVKSHSKRSGDGEPNLRRWSLKASAILSTHPKIV